MVRQLTDTVSINSSPDRIWEWLTGLAEHYTDWHEDHVSAEWVRGEPNHVGSVLEAVEDLAGNREVLRFELTALDPPHLFQYRIRGSVSALLPGGSFTVDPENGGSRFTATIAYRFGSLTERLFRRKMAALNRHMQEEGRSLKTIIESSRA